MNTHAELSISTDPSKPTHKLIDRLKLSSSTIRPLRAIASMLCHMPHIDRVELIPLDNDGYAEHCFDFVHKASTRSVCVRVP